MSDRSAFAEALDEVAAEEFLRDVTELSRGRGRPELPELAGPPARRPRGVWADGTPVTDADRDAVWEMHRRVSAARYPQRSGGVYAALERPGGMPPMLRWALGYGDV